MSVFYCINWLVKCEDILEEWLHMVSSLTTVKCKANCEIAIKTSFHGFGPKH